jgi:glycosyltransferase involved in cell wall biosynthesis
MAPAFWTGPDDRAVARGLADDFSVTYVFIGARTERSTSSPDVDDVVVLSRPSMIEIIWNFIFKRKLSFQERLFFSRYNLQAIYKLCRSKSSAAIIVDMIRMSPYLQGHGAILKICDMDDLLSKRYRQLSQLQPAFYNVFGTFAHVPIFRILHLLAKPFLKPILHVEARLIEQRETDVLRAVDLVLLVSPVEAADLSAKSDGTTVVMDFPPSMPLPVHAPLKTKEQAADGLASLLFIGDMRTPANSLAINFILEEILPALRSAGLAHRMLVVGRAPVETCRKIQMTPHASHLGWVNDLSDVYDQADVVLCPFLVGTGVNIKILEGMAHAKPVVTTSLGAEGISAKPGSEFVVADGQEGIVRAITELARNKELRRRIGAAAVAFIAAQHDPFRLQKRLKEKLREKLNPHEESLTILAPNDGRCGYSSEVLSKSRAELHSLWSIAMRRLI